MFLGFDSYGNGIVFSWISGLVFSFRSGDLVMLVLLVRLRILYVSVIVYSYNEKIWLLVVGKIFWFVKILLFVKISVL